MESDADSIWAQFDEEDLEEDLADLDKETLSLVATSVPSERVFSTAGQLLSERRNRLSNSNAQKLLFLNGNMK